MTDLKWSSFDGQTWFWLTSDDARLFLGSGALSMMQDPCQKRIKIGQTIHGVLAAFPFKSGNSLHSLNTIRTIQLE